MRVLCVDFWSDGNLGDAIMQKEILDQVFSREEEVEVHVVSCFGKNQFQLNAFHESKHHLNSIWHPAFFKTYIKLDKYTESEFNGRYYRLLITVAALIVSTIRLKLYKYTGNVNFLGFYKYFKDMEFDVLIFNGRNYRDFGSHVKNFINNQPLIIHQELFSLLNPSTKKINAGVSIWGLSKGLLNRLKVLWGGYDLNIAREQSTFDYIKTGIGVKNVRLEKDLSFPFLSTLVRSKHENDSLRRVGFSITEVPDLNNYIQFINEIGEHYKSKGYDIFVIEQVYLPHESVDHLYEKLNFDFELIKTKSITEMLNIYDVMDFVVSSRMHGSIMALSQGCKVASIAYDRGAKWGIITDELVDYPLFSPEQVTAKEVIEYLNSDKSNIHAKELSVVLTESDKRYIHEFLQNIDT